MRDLLDDELLQVSGADAGDTFFGNVDNEPTYLRISERTAISSK